MSKIKADEQFATNSRSVEGCKTGSDTNSRTDNKSNKGRSGKSGSVFLYLRGKVWYVAAACVLLLAAVGVMASNGWLPRTDALTGKKTGWFGKELPKNASSSWNPFAAPLPTPTPQLSKEYIYAGSRLLAVEDAGANAAPPADLAVWRPSSGIWYVLGGPGSQQTSYEFGTAGDVPMPGDYDGDGKTDFAVFRPSTQYWYIVNSSTSTISQYPFGTSGDTPVTSDFDGDGKTDAAVFRSDTPSAGLATWYVLNSSGIGVSTIQFGLNSDEPSPADFDGDGKADIAVWRNSNNTFYSIDSSTQTLAQANMASSGEPVSADFDGDGKANYAILSGNSWKIMNSAITSVSSVTWQNSGDIPVQNDYDGDGIVDIAVWRSSNGNWYIRQSASGNSLRQVQWGTAGDLPVPAYFRR